MAEPGAGRTVGLRVGNAVTQRSRERAAPMRHPPESLLDSFNRRREWDATAMPSRGCETWSRAGSIRSWAARSRRPRSRQVPFRAGAGRDRDRGKIDLLGRACGGADEAANR